MNEKAVGKRRYVKYVFILCFGLLNYLTLATELVNGAGAEAAAELKITLIQTDNLPEIKCYTSVVDEEGEYLPGLKAENFSITQNSQPVHDFQVTPVSSQHEQVAVILVFDRSGSMAGAPLTAAKEAGADFINRMSRQDLLALITFSDTVNTLTELTTDREIISNTLGAITANGDTAFYDALKEALAQFVAAKATRKAIVALTDGNDNYSRFKLTDCYKLAKQTGTPIYVVGLGRKVNEAELKQLAEETGGYCFLTDSPKSLKAVYTKIAGQIQNQYLLSYQGIMKEGSWSTVEIALDYHELRSSDKKQFIVWSKQEQPTNLTAPISKIIWLTLAFFLLFDLIAAVILIRRNRLTV